MKTRAYILFLIVVDILINFLIFFPIKRRDDLEDYFILLPIVICFNLILGILLRIDPDKGYKEIGKAFLINSLIAPTLFFLFAFVTRNYYYKHLYTIYDFEIDNNYYSLNINNKGNYYYTSYYGQDSNRHYSLMGNLILETDSEVVMTNRFIYDYPCNSSVSRRMEMQDTLIIRHDTLWGLGSEPIYVKKR